MSAESTDLTLTSAPVALESPPIFLYEAPESYAQLVWRRFRRSTVSIVGAGMVLAGHARRGASCRQAAAS